MAKQTSEMSRLGAIERLLDQAGIERQQDLLTLSTYQRVALLVESRDRLAAAVHALALGDGESGD